MSASSAAYSAPNSLNTSPPIVVESTPTLTFRAPPMRAASFDTAVAVRVAVPSRSRLPVRSASQTSSAFSKALPVRRLSVSRTLGMLPHWTIDTARPLSSVNRFGSGTRKSRGVPGVGGSAGNGACAMAVAATASNAATSRHVDRKAVILVTASPSSPG